MPAESVGILSRFSPPAGVRPRPFRLHAVHHCKESLESPRIPSNCHQYGRHSWGILWDSFPIVAACRRPAASVSTPRRPPAQRIPRIPKNPKESPRLPPESANLGPAPAPENPQESSNRLGCFRFLPAAGHSRASSRIFETRSKFAHLVAIFGPERVPFRVHAPEHPKHLGIPLNSFDYL